jgi:hypothetical protein
MAIEKREEQTPIFTEEAEAELSDKLKKLLLEVIDKGRINLEHGTDILSEAIGRPLNLERSFCSDCKTFCNGCNLVCHGCVSVAGCACPIPDASVVSHKS